MKKNFQLWALVVVLTTSPLLYGLLDVQEVVEMDAACKAFVDAVSDRPVAHLEVEIQESILQLHELYPDHRWSALFLGVLQDIQNDGNVIVHQQVVDVVKECLDFCALELEKNLPYAHEIGTIQSYLLDYQQFLSSAKSRLDVHSALLSKARSYCVRPCSNALKCFELKSLLVDGNDVLPFLPTGPIPPVETNNYFYATKQNILGGIVSAGFFSGVTFDVVNATDNSWIFDGSDSFTAQVSGVFLVNVAIYYAFSYQGGLPNSNEITLQPTKNGVPIANATQVMHISIPPGNLTTICLSSNFIVEVSEQEVLNFLNMQLVAADPLFTNADYFNPLPTEGNIGSVTITRLR